MTIADDDGPVEWPRTEHDLAAAGGIDEVNQSSIESFPASDPPSWIPASIG